MSDMGTGEMGTPTKTTKTSTPQPPSSTPMAYPDWAAAFQAYYGTGTTPLPPPGYFTSTVASGPQPHPYMWGAQPLMQPYGTPPPYAAMYPHGGIYAHPSMPPGTHPFSPYSMAATNASEAQGGTHPFSPYSMATTNASEAQGGAAAAVTDAEGKSTDGKTKSPTKISKGSLGSLGMLTGKGSDGGKGNSGSMNGGFSQSGDSGSEGSTEGSEGNSENGSQGVRKGNFDQVTSEAPANSIPFGSAQDVNHSSGNHPVAAMRISIAGKQVVGAGPLTNLNIGMDYWNGGEPAVLANSRGKRDSAPVTTTALIPSTNMMVTSQEGVPSELSLQDERELKRQRRKQSNRESARRSRLRKQADCEELAARVETLDGENASLRSELNRVTEQYKKLSAENSALMDQLQMRRSQLEGIEGESNTNVPTAERKRDLEVGLSLQRDTREANETSNLAGTSNVERQGGTL